MNIFAKFRKVSRIFANNFFEFREPIPMRTTKFCQVCEMRSFVKFRKVSLQKNLTKVRTFLLPDKKIVLAN